MARNPLVPLSMLVAYGLLSTTQVPPDHLKASSMIWLIYILGLDLAILLKICSFLPRRGAGGSLRGYYSAPRHHLARETG